jgi:hypothetical protein
MMFNLYFKMEGSTGISRERDASRARSAGSEKQRDGSRGREKKMSQKKTW